MEHLELIQSTLDYIEENLPAPLNAAELASHAGFSVYHFYRLFQQYTGMPVMQYIQQRRLLHAIYAIKNGKKRIDAALMYGFDTYAGFYKAFQREFSCTPSEYLQKNRAKLPTRTDLTKEKQIMLTYAQAQKVLKYWNMENEPIHDLYYESSGHKAPQAVCIGNDYILKRSLDPQNFQKGFALTKLLQETGVETQMPLPSADGTYMIKSDGWYYCLFARPRGKTVTSASFYGEGGATRARFVGEVIGQLHRVLQNADMQVKQADLLGSVRGWALPKVQEKLCLPEKFWANFLAVFEKLYPSLPQQIIHRDPNPSSILMAQNGWGILEWEMAERSIRLFDPCYAATAILSESFDLQNESRLLEWVDIYQNILHGYDSVVCLNEQEKQAAPYVVLANQLVCVAWFADQSQYKELYEINRQMTKWLIKHFEKLSL